MAFDLKILGKLPKEDVGKIVIIIMFLISGSYLVTVYNQITTMIGILLIFSALFLSFAFFINGNKNDYYNRVIPALSDMENFARDAGLLYPWSHLITQYEAVRFRAVNDGKTELADELEKKINELKLSHDEMVDQAKRNQDLLDSLKSNSMK